MTHSNSRKLTLQDILHHVKQLPAAQQEQLRLSLNKDAAKISASTSGPLMPERINLDQLAIEQGVPEDSLANLNGDFWPPDENVDDFISTIRQWRDETRAQ